LSKKTISNCELRIALSIFRVFRVFMDENRALCYAEIVMNMERA